MNIRILILIFSCFLFSSLLKPMIEDIKKEHGHKIVFLRDSMNIAAETHLLRDLIAIKRQRAALETPSCAAFFAMTFLKPTPETLRLFSREQKAIALIFRKIFYSDEPGFLDRYTNAIKELKAKEYKDPEIKNILVHLEQIKENGNTIDSFINSIFLRVETPFIAQAREFSHILLENQLSFTPDVKKRLDDLLYSYYDRGLAKQLLGENHKKWSIALEKRGELLRSYFPDNKRTIIATTIPFDLSRMLEDFLPSSAKIDTDYLTDLQQQPKKKSSQARKKNKSKSRRQRGGKKAAQREQHTSTPVQSTALYSITKPIIADPYDTVKKRYTLLYPDCKIITLNESMASVEYLGNRYTLFNATGKTDHLNPFHTVLTLKEHFRVSRWTDNPQETVQMIGIRPGNTSKKLIRNHRIPKILWEAFYPMALETTFTSKETGIQFFAQSCPGQLNDDDGKYELGILPASSPYPKILFHSYFQEEQFERILKENDLDQEARERISAAWHEANSSDNSHP